MSLKLLIINLLILCQMAAAVQASEVKPNTRRPKHIIFLIHGIAGNKTHFGYMSKALRKVLNQKDPSTKYIVKTLEYDTGNNDKTPEDFAKDIDLLIKKATGPSRFKPGDKFSFIMHSQGGLIGSIWLFQSLLSTPGYSTPAFIQQMDSFITLGSPFWGAKTARWGSEIKSLADSLNVNVPLPFGRNELEQMSFGSDMIYDFRMVMIDPKFRPHIDYLKSHIRFLNIVGVANLLDPIGSFVSGTQQYEDDGAVPLSSARFNFLYNQSIKSEYELGDRVSLDEVKEVNMAPYVVVKAMHRSPLPEVENLEGIAQIPKHCIKKECEHPTFTYLWQHILDQEVSQLDGSLGDFKSFLLDINVRVEAENDFECEDLDVEVLNLDGTSLEGSNIEILKNYELYAHGVRESTKYPDFCRIYYTGSIKRLLEGRKEAVLVKISGDILKTRFIEMQVKESYSSFIDVNVIER